jgi:hypothetical protein
MWSKGDLAVEAHLERVANMYDEAGVLDYVRECVQGVWRANRRRWSPQRHFDDTNVLGYQTSRNVNNRIIRTVRESDVADYVLAETEPGVALLTVRGFRLRVVKASIECGLDPDFENDFDWSQSATRSAAAQRNSNSYLPNQADDWRLEFEDDPRPQRLRDVDACRDFFLVWGAAINSDRTAGWLGLPRAGDLPWMGVMDLWVDSEGDEVLEGDGQDDADPDEEED